MKKGKLFFTFLMAAVLSVTAVPPMALAEEVSQEQEAQGEGETSEETEHSAAYYEEIQSNGITGWPQGSAVESDAAIVMDADTGAVLYAKNVDRREYPASITKIMTTLIALEKGNLSDVVTFSENAVYSIEFGSSHLGLTEGEKLTLEQCLYGIMLASANEISNAVAEHIAGDIDSYVELMNQRAAELGCTGTHFVNVHGLHDENHYVCAKDMALIMREALKNPKFCEIIKTVEYNYPETNLVKEVRYFLNHHKMIAEEGMLYDGCIGGKTGFTDEAWNTLVTAAEKDGQKLIAVVMKAPGLYPSYEDTRVLLDYGFEQFQNQQIANVNGADVEITGITDSQELEKIRQADILAEPFSMVGSTMVTLPAGVTEKDLKKTMDFTTQTLNYTYQGQMLGSVPFTYSGQWEAPTEATQAASETEMAKAAQEAPQTEKENPVWKGIRGVLTAALGAVGFLYNQMDAFIKENTVAAAVIGAVLLLIFVPLLMVAVIRHRKYQNLMVQREEEMERRRQLEEEIEQKSAIQVEEELREAQLQEQREAERKARKKRELEELEQKNSEPSEPEEEEGYFLDEESFTREEQETLEEMQEQPVAKDAVEEALDEEDEEDEYIEVPVEEEMKQP